MYGKHFASMYDGSMIGKGAVVFAVWGFVIATQKPDRMVGAQVEINTELLAFILGEEESEVVEAVNLLCSPDHKSRTPDEEGRRLIKIGTFSYRVVNGAKYLAIREEEKRREQNRTAQERHRAKSKKPGTGPLPGEQAFVQAEERGASESEKNGIVSQFL